MSTKLASSTHHPYRARYLALVVAGLLAALPGYARATLFSPSVEATIEYLVPTTTISQSVSVGPATVTHSDTVSSAAALTDYGINRASSRIAGWTGGDRIHPVMSAISKWTDTLTVTTPDVALNQPLSFLFSFRLDGSLAAHEDDFSTAIARVRFRTQTAGIDGIYASLPLDSGLLSVQPTPSSTAGGDASATIDQTLLGNYTIHNGEAFNLIAILETSLFGDFMGPPASLSADSLFYNSAEWLGGSVLVGGNPVSSFTITSGSGHNYNSPAPVPEPATILLLGSGLAGLGWAAWRRKRGSGPSSDRTDA